MTMPDAVSSLVGFLEEAPGKKSSTRLIALVCVGLAATFALAMDWYVWYQTVHMRPIDTNVMVGFVSGITAFIASGAVAVINRTPTTP